MVHIEGASIGYLAKYHATGHDRSVAEAVAPHYLDAEQVSLVPIYGGRMATFFGMTGAYNRQKFMMAAEGKYQINAGGDEVNGYADVRYHASGKKADENGVKQDVDAAIEVVISPPKSWSIAAYLAKGERRKELKEMLRTASVHAMNRMEDLIQVRVTRDRVTTLERPRGIQWTGFRHSNTRRGDPDEHGHYVVNKQVLCADDKVRTIDEASWLRIHYEMDVFFKTELSRLAASAGYKLDITENGPELRCISPELRKAFSTAREEIRVFLEGHGIDLEKSSDSQRQWANMATRLGKVIFDEAHVDRMYRSKVAAAGIDYDTIKISPEIVGGYDLTPVKSAREAILMALDELHERSDVIKHRHELALVAAKHRGFTGTGAEINDAIDVLMKEGYLSLRTPVGRGERVTAGSCTLTSRFAVEREQACTAYVRHGFGRGERVTTLERAEAAILRVERQIAEGIKLTPGQRAMVHSALGLAHSDRVMAVRGDPATGITTAMQAIRYSAAEAGWKVLGLAPSDMGRDALIEFGVVTETIQLATKSERWWDEVDSKTLIIMDESGMVDSRKMNIVLERAQARGARLCLVGDYDQVESVEAGTPFKRVCKLTDKSTLVKMTEMSRTRTDEMKSLHQLSRDDQATAIRKIMDGGPAGKMWSSASATARYEYVSRQWLALDQTTRFRVPIVVDTNADRKGVTEEIRARMSLESIFTVQSFESLQLERAEHLIAAKYEPGDAIRMTNKIGRFLKGDMLTVESVRDGVVKVKNQKGEMHDFRPEMHGSHATLGEYEECQIGVGEIIRFASKWKNADIRNGDRGIVRAIDVKGVSTVAIVDYDGKVRSTKLLDLSTPGISVRHGLANTVRGVQGASIDKGIYLASNTSRNVFLVGITRFKFEVTLVADASTKQRLEALIVRAQTRQHKEPAFPTKADLSQRFRRIAVNAAWPQAKASCAQGLEPVQLLPYLKTVDMDETHMRAFLTATKRTYGDAHIGGSKQFVELARRVAADEGMSSRFTFSDHSAKKAKRQALAPKQSTPRTVGM